MNDATRRMTHWNIDIRRGAPMVEKLTMADDVRGFVCGHVHWGDGTPGSASACEEFDVTPVDWAFVLKVRHTVW
jgi:hypothetical protein